MELLWILGVLAALFFAGAFVWRKRGIEIMKWWRGRKFTPLTGTSWSSTASQRGRYGSVAGNVKWFGGWFLLPMIPLILWKLSLLLTLPTWLAVFAAYFFTTLAISLAVVVAAFLIGYPLVAERFLWSIYEDPPGRPEPTKPTKFLEPWSYQVPEGRALARVGAGGNAIDFTMRQSDADIAYDVPGVNFARWRDRYEIIPNSGSPSEVPVYSAWHRYHVKASGGLVFGGFFWYRRLHTYEIDIVKAQIGADGKLKLQILPNQKTDHVRVRPFAWAVIVDIFTNDRYQVTIVITFELECVNPDKMFFGRDRWERLFSQAVSTRAVVKGKTITVFDLLGGRADNVRTVLADSIQGLAGEVFEDLGIRMLKSQVPGYLQVGTTDEERKALTEHPVATQKAKAQMILGKAEAYVERRIVSQRGKGAAETQHGEVMSLHQALETIGEKGGTVFATLGTGGPSDTYSQAILAELQKNKQT